MTTLHGAQVGKAWCGPLTFLQEASETASLPLAAGPVLLPAELAWQVPSSYPVHATGNWGWGGLILLPKWRLQSQAGPRTHVWRSCSVATANQDLGESSNSKRITL